MDELRVPTNAMTAEVRCADGQTLLGRVFIPFTSSHHTGGMRPEEWLNLAPPFFAFLPDEEQKAVLLNKHEILVVSIPAVQESADEEEEEQELPRRRIAVELRDMRIEGILIVDMPEGHRRVLDHLNRTDVFLTVRAEERWHLVNKWRITRVTEIGEE